jgi:sec-independent protein translocase protein TatA
LVATPLFPLQGGTGGLSFTPMNTTLAFIGGLGGQEMVVIFLIVLLLFGAKKLPELARGVGKSMGEFKKAREDFEKEITRAEDDVRIKEAAGKEAHDKA